MHLSSTFNSNAPFVVKRGADRHKNLTGVAEPVDATPPSSAGTEVPDRPVCQKPSSPWVGPTLSGQPALWVPVTVGRDRHLGP